MSFKNDVEKTGRDRYYEHTLANTLRQIDKSAAVPRFLSKIGSKATKVIYACELKLYFRWLKEEGRTSMKPDELVRDNLKCIFNGDPTDVETKRRHTDWLNEYVNTYLAGRDYSLSRRSSAASAITGFYKRNDSPLFGDFQVSPQKPTQREKALKAEDIRAVLLALSLRTRAPLLAEWQSGIEINRLLYLKRSEFRGLDEGEYPVRIDLMGRKKHDRPYATFIGRDAIDHIRALARKGDDEWVYSAGEQRRDEYLNESMRKAAVRLMGQGLIDKYPPSAWHTHALRHSFETEASHAGVKSEIRDYFLGHVSGIQWVYNHRDELHPEDLVNEYLRIEPYVSLSPSEVTIKGEYEERNRVLAKRVEQLERDYEALKRELGVSRGTPYPSSRSAP